MTTGRTRIAWLTADYFLPVDVPIVPRLATHYDVDWLLIQTRTGRTGPSPEAAEGSSFAPRSVALPHRQRDPRLIGWYLALANDIRSRDYHLVYTSFHGPPYFLPILANRVDVNKIIYGVHDASTPKGASREWAMELYHQYVFHALRRFHVFSKNQLKAIETLAPHGTHYYAPLPLIDYGPSLAAPPDEPIRFLFFGRIRRYKRLDLLIEAFRRLPIDVGPVELRIAGQCDEWDVYRPLIAGDHRISTRIELVPDADIPDMLGTCHYVVLPYQDIAQSAVLTLALQYGKPVIAADIDGLKQDVVEGRTGFFFKRGSVEDLTTVMRDVIAAHRSRYPSLTASVADLAQRERSIDGIVERYRAFIDHAVTRARQ